MKFSRSDDESLSPDPTRRRAGAVLGCLTLLLLLSLLVWFIATHTQTFQNPSTYGTESP